MATMGTVESEKTQKRKVRPSRGKKEAKTIGEILNEQETKGKKQLNLNEF